MSTHVGQLFDFPVNQVVTRQDHALGALGALDRLQMKRIQQELLRLGYPLQGGADGVAGRTTKKAVALVQAKAGLPVNGVPDMRVLQALDSGNRSLAPTDADKAAVRALWSGGSGAPASTGTGLTTTSGGGAPATGGGLVVAGSGAPVASSGGVTDPMAAPAGAAADSLMKKYESWLKQQAWLPEQLKNPYVAAGVVTAGVAVIGYGLYRAFSSSPAAESAMIEPAMAGIGERDMPKPKRKKRKSRKSKK